LHHRDRVVIREKFAARLRLYDVTRSRTSYDRASQAHAEQRERAGPGPGLTGQ